MTKHVKVAIIGGGVVGCSVLYHLAKLGCTDSLLIERSDLTSGSTWHAAGGFHTLNGDPNVARLQQYTINLYKEIEELSGQSCGLHLTGGIMLAGTDERMDFLRMEHAKGRYDQQETRIIDIDEAYAMFPMMEPSYFKGGIFNPYEGHLDPSGTTYAYAKSAKKLGADYEINNRVMDVTQKADGTWCLTCENGVIEAEHVVNAGGLWARECGRMVGLELPILAMEHHYIITEDMDEVRTHNEKTGTEVLHIIDFEGEIYMRQERGGMLMGTYERAATPWSEKETPWDFGHELLQENLERIAPSLEVGFNHFPAFNKVGIKQAINGPFTFAPDGNPVVGPVRGLTNYWCACGVMAGFSQGGGVGLSLANWIVNGDPGGDIWGMDVARFGDWTSMAYTNARVRENYSNRFRIMYPNEVRPAGRPLRTSPIYERMRGEFHACFATGFGLETPAWFADNADNAVENLTFRRSNAFEFVRAECEAVRSAAGLLETTGFAKYHVTGKDAYDNLNRIMAGRIPDKGRMSLCPMLNENGMIIGDFTVAMRGDGSYMIFGSGAAEEYHMRWFEKQLRGDCNIAPLGLGLCGLAIAGPKSRAILQALSDENFSQNNVKFMDFFDAYIGMIPCQIGRISFTGELGYEIWVKPDYLQSLFTMLLQAGKEHGLKLFGLRALNSLRIEKLFGGWATDFRPIYSPKENILGRFINLKNKGDFIGRKAMEKYSPRRLLVGFEINDNDTDVDALGNEPIWRGDTVVGWVTSGGYGFSVKKSLAMGYIDLSAYNKDGDKGDADNYAIEICGIRRPVKLIEAAPWDPSGERMRLS